MPSSAARMDATRQLPKHLSQHTVRAVLLLALPVLAEQILAVGVGLVDTWLTGNFLPGDKYLAAIGQMAYLMWLIPSLFSFVGIGATALVSRFVGANERELANRSMHQAFLLGGILAAVITVWLSLGGGWLIGILQLPPDAAELAEVYLRYLVPVIPAIMIERVAISCLHGAGDTVAPMLVRVLVNFCNVVLSIALVVGFGPLPEMGWNGIALGTAISHVVGAMTLLAILFKGRAGLRFEKANAWLDRSLATRLLNVGIPGGVDRMLILGCHLWFLALINGLGTAQAAAHGLGVRIESLAYLPGGAFQVAATTLVGQYLGAKDPRRAGRSVLVSLLLGGGVMTLAGIVFYVFGFELATFFTGGKNAETAEQAAMLLRIAAFAMPCLATAMIVSGALRGAGDTRWPLVINVFGMLGVRITTMYLILSFSSLHTWAAGWSSLSPGHGILQAAWWTMFLDVSVRALLVMLRFLQGGWKTTKI